MISRLGLKAYAKHREYNFLCGKEELGVSESMEDASSVRKKRPTLAYEFSNISSRECPL